MYHWVEDKDFLNKMKARCSDIVNQLVQAINSEGRMSVKQHLVGSGAKNLITQNAEEPIDLDYNLEVVNSGEFRINDCRAIKNYVQEMFDDILSKVGWNNCQDSTSALTTDYYHFNKGNKTSFSIDLCIIYVDSNGSWYRLIHEKTGYVQSDRYYWNEARQSRGLTDRVEWLKGNDCWLEVRDAYLDKKNMYLTRNDHNHHSFNVYIEAVNEIYGKYNGGYGYVQTLFGF